MQKQPPRLVLKGGILEEETLVEAFEEEEEYDDDDHDFEEEEEEVAVIVFVVMIPINVITAITLLENCRLAAWSWCLQPPHIPLCPFLYPFQCLIIVTVTPFPDLLKRNGPCHIDCTEALVAPEKTVDGHAGGQEAQRGVLHGPVHDKELWVNDQDDGGFITLSVSMV